MIQTTETLFIYSVITSLKRCNNTHEPSARICLRLMPWAKENASSLSYHYQAHDFYIHSSSPTAFQQTHCNYCFAPFLPEQNCVQLKKKH